jgi:hypothetical protein
MHIHRTPTTKPLTVEASDSKIIISLNEENNFNGGESHGINYTSRVMWMHNQKGSHPPHPVPVTHLETR